MATVRDRYVDTDVVGGSANGTSWANAYSSLNAAEQAEDDSGNIVGSDEYVVFHCRGVTAADTAAVTVDGWTTDATRYIQIQCDSGDGHSGVWTTGKYRLTAGLISFEEYSRLQGLQITRGAYTANDQQTVLLGYCDPGEFRVDRCLISGPGGSTYRTDGFHVYPNSVTTLYLWNSIIIDLSSVLYSTAARLRISTTYVYSCTIIGDYTGLEVVSGTNTAKNCYAAKSGAGNAYEGTITKTTCASSDTTGSVGLQNIAYSTSSGAYFTNVTAGSEDLRIASASSALVNAGTTLTDDPPGAAALGVDIAGQTRA